MADSLTVRELRDVLKSLSPDLKVRAATEDDSLDIVLVTRNRYELLLCVSDEGVGPDETVLLRMKEDCKP